jgi:hypothetical protein
MSFISGPVVSSLVVGCRQVSSGRLRADPARVLYDAGAAGNGNAANGLAVVCNE